MAPKPTFETLVMPEIGAVMPVPAMVVAPLVPFDMMAVVVALTIITMAVPAVAVTMGPVRVGMVPATVFSAGMMSAAMAAAPIAAMIIATAASIAAMRPAVITVTAAMVVDNARQSIAAAAVSAIATMAGGCRRGPANQQGGEQGQRCYDAKHGIAPSKGFANCNGETIANRY